MEYNSVVERIMEEARKALSPEEFRELEEYAMRK
jgi:hypothetical protein